MSFVVLILACGQETATNTVITPEKEQLEITDPVNEEELQEEELQEGSFAMLLVISQELQDPNPLNDSWGKQQTTTISRLDWSRQGLDVSYHETYCSHASSDDFGTTIQYTDGYLTARSGQIRQGQLSSSQVGAEFHIPTYSDLNGIHLDSIDDPLPSNSNDSRIYDMDSDGKLGITAIVNTSIGTGEVYAIQRLSYTFDGILVNPERIEGYVTPVPEQISLAFSEYWLEYGTSALREDTDPTRSYFIIQEIDSTWDCSSIINHQSSLF